MKFRKTDILNKEIIDFDELLTFDANAFNGFSRLNDVKDIEVSGSLTYDDEMEIVNANIHVEGIMICPCAISNEDVEVILDTDEKLRFSFKKVDDQDIIQVNKDTLDLYPIVLQIILAEVPIKVVKENVTYPKGQNWEVMSEAEYQEKKGREIDPRLAKLQEIKFDED